MAERKVLSGKTASLQEEELTVKRLNHLGCDRTEQEDPRRISEGAIVHHSLTEEKAESLTLRDLTREGFLKLKKNRPKIVRKLALPAQIEVETNIFCIIL